MQKVKPYMPILFYIAFFILMVVTISEKRNFHVDEVFSYGLSNHVGSTSLRFEEGVRYEPAQTPFMDYVAVSPSEKFDYANVWKNQVNDVHPPLYYVILHTICSLLPGSFSVWYAASINLVFALLTLSYLRRLMRLLTDKEAIVNVVTVGFICSAGTLSAVSFLRMYIMAMFWVTMLSYLYMKHISETCRAGFYVEAAVVTILGALTHYYCIVYAVLISVVFGLFLLGKKRWKETFLFCCSMAVAGGLSYLIFPAMLEHVFHGQRGTQSFRNFANSADRGERIGNFYSFLNNQMFGGKLSYLLIGIGLLAVFVALAKRVDRGAAERYLLISIPCIVFFLLVSKTAVYQTDRYLVPIYGVVFAGVLCLALTLLENLWSPGTVAAISCGLMALILWGSWHSAGWEYLYRETKDRMEMVEAHASADCICIYDGSRWKVQADLSEYTKYNSVTFLRWGSFDPAEVDRFIETEDAVISIVGKVDQESCLAELMQYLPRYAGYTSMGSYGYSTSYALK